MTNRIRSRSAISIGALSLLALISTPGLAQEPAADAGQEAPETQDQTINLRNQEATNPKVFLFDYGVPSSPGLTLLGIDKDKISQSNSLKPFVLSLPGLLASKGEGKAVALDASLGALFIPRSQQYYQQYKRQSLWFRTRANVALYEGVADDDATKQKASRLAIGVSTSLLPSSDPLLAKFPGSSGRTSAYIACIDRVRPPDEQQLGDEEDEGDVLTQEQTATCRGVADLSARLGTDLDLGAGLLLEGDPGKLEGFGDDSLVLWGSFRTALGVSGPAGDTYADYRKWYEDFGRWFMLGASGRAAFGESVATGDTTTPQVRADTFTAWAGLESYSKSNRFTVQIGRQKISPEGDAFDAFGGSRTVYHATFDQALGDTGVWVSLSYGKAEGSGALKSDSVARVTLSFAPPDARKIFGGP